MRSKRQQELLKASMDIVAQDGFSRLTIRNIAAKVGVTEAAVYRHFKSKLELLTTLIEDIQATVVTHFDRLALEAEEKDLATLMSQFMHGLFHELTVHPAYASFLFSEELFHIQPEIRPIMLQVMTENMQSLTLTIEKLQKMGLCRQDISAGDLTPVLMGSVRLVVSRWNISRDTKQTENLCNSFVRTITLLFKASN